MEITKTITLPDEAATLRLGQALAEQLRGGDLLCLQGDLGAGKTTLTRAIVQALGWQGTVKSPTYTIVEPYSELLPPVYHCDLYRIADPQELELLGFYDYLGQGAIVIIEWPERLPGLASQAQWRMVLQTVGQGRMIEISAGQDRLAAIKRHYAAD